MRDRGQQPMYDSGGSGNYDLPTSTADALNPLDILKKFVYFILFGLALGIKDLVSNLDKAGQLGGGPLVFLWAILDAIKSGIGTALGSTWRVIINPKLYIETHSWGSVLFAIISMVLVVFLFYQPVAVVMNVFDGQKGQKTPFILRVFATFLLVLFLSSIAYYFFGGSTITNQMPPINNTAPVNNINYVINAPSPTPVSPNTTSVINLG